MNFSQCQSGWYTFHMGIWQQFHQLQLQNNINFSLTNILPEGCSFEIQVVVWNYNWWTCSQIPIWAFPKKTCPPPQAQAPWPLAWRSAAFLVMFVLLVFVLFVLRMASFCSYAGLHRALGRWRSYQFGRESQFGRQSDTVAQWHRNTEAQEHRHRCNIAQ